METSQATKNALAPIEFIVSAVGSLVLLGLLLTIPAMVFGGGSLLGFGDEEVCLSTSSNVLVVRSQTSNAVHVDGLEPGARSWPEQVNICQWHPSLGQHLLYVLTLLPELVYGLGFLFLTWRLIRYSRQEGFFVPDTALRLGRLGLFVLLGALLVPAVSAAGSALLLPTMVAPSGGWFNVWMRFFHLSWAALFAGFGLLTIHRVMAQTVPMQAELDATV